jgi:hypothetical protein
MYVLEEQPINMINVSECLLFATSGRAGRVALEVVVDAADNGLA